MKKKRTTSLCTLGGECSKLSLQLETPSRPLFLPMTRFCRVFGPRTQCNDFCVPPICANLFSEGPPRTQLEYANSRRRLRAGNMPLRRGPRIPRAILQSPLSMVNARVVSFSFLLFFSSDVSIIVEHLLLLLKVFFTFLLLLLSPHSNHFSYCSYSQKECSEN